MKHNKLHDLLFFKYHSWSVVPTQCEMNHQNEDNVKVRECKILIKCRSKRINEIYEV